MSFLNSMISGIITAGQLFSKKESDAKESDSSFIFTKQPMDHFFTAGFGKAVILPDDIEQKKYYIAGYCDNNPAKGVIDPQYVCAFLLDDHSDNGSILFLSFDVVGLLKKDVDRLKEYLSDFMTQTGCGTIIVMSTHNHAGIDTMGLWGPLPFTGKNPKFMKTLFSSAKSAAQAAYDNSKTGRLYFGSVIVPDLQEDIRTPEVYSKALSRFRFIPDDGSNEIWFLNFAAHCESLQGCNHLVSADYPCYLRERIQSETGAQTIYAVGAVGGMISMQIDEENTLRKEHRLLESTRKIGNALADYALSIKDERQLKPIINRITQPFYVEVENPLLTLAAQIGIISVDRYMTPEPAIKTQLTYMEIDDQPLLFLPCELFPELAYGGYLSVEKSGTGLGPEVNPKTLCDIIRDPSVVIFGLSDDEIGYVIPPNDFYLHPDKPYLDKGIDHHGRRHYEETNSAGPKTATAIAATLERVMCIVRKRKNDGDCQ